MADQIIRPADLPNRANPVASEKIPVDNGVSVGGATIQSIVESGRPAASRPEAEAGTNAEKAMTPLTTDQKIEYEIGRSIASKAQGDKADSAVQEIVGGANTTVDNTDPQRPVISSSGNPSAGFKSDIFVVDGQTDWRVARNYKTVSELLADDGSGDMGMGYAGSGSNVIVAPGDIVTAQGFRYEVAASDASAPLQTAGGVKFIPERDILGTLNAGAFGYVAETSADQRPAAQAAIDYAESLGVSITLVFPGGRALLKSLCPNDKLPSALTGNRVGLVLRKPNMVKLWGLDAKVYFDLSVEEVQSAGVLFAVAPASSDSAFLSIQGISFHGSATHPGNPSHYPKNTFRADYEKTSYAVLRDMNVSHSREDNFVIQGFVVELTKIRARFAGDQHSNFWFRAITGGAVTAYSIRGCVADYAGLHGYRFSGSPGHTYCHLDTCSADHIGRDGNNQTIAGNELTAFAYSFENVRNIVMTACGAEWCNSSIRLHNARTFEVNGFFGVNNGSTNGVIIPASIAVSMYFERINISSFEENIPSNISKRLRIENVTAFNTNGVSLDHSIRREDVEFVGGTKSSARALVFTPNDFYRDGNRWDGGAVVYGDRLHGNSGVNWFDRSNTVAKQTFLKRAPSGGGAVSILEITDTSSDGNLWIVLDVIVARNSGGMYAPSRYQVMASCRGADRSSVVEKIGTNGFGFTVATDWSSNILRFSVGQEFAMIFVEATVMADQNTSNGKFFQWV